MGNTVAVGAILVLLGLETKITKKILQKNFAGKKGKEEVVKQNIAA